jgi:predicted O-linked N-acetylglucosamine transferase (SPINDLY family)
MTQLEGDNIGALGLINQIAALVSTGKIDQAETILNALMKVDNIPYQAWFFHGVINDIRGKAEDALVSFVNAHALEPHEPNVLNAVIALTTKLKCYAQAFEYAKKAMLLNSNSSLLLANIGVACEAMNEHQQAIDYYQRAIKLNPSEQIAQINISGILVKSKQIDAAIQHVQQALSFLPKTIELYNNLIEAYLQNISFDEALIICEKALIINPKCAEILFKNGLILAYLCRFDESQKALDLAQSLDVELVGKHYPHLLNHSNFVDVRVDARQIFLDLSAHLMSRCCWQLLDHYVQYLLSTLDFDNSHTSNEQPKFLSLPIALPISGIDRLKLMKSVAENYFSISRQIKPQPFSHESIRHHGKIRVGYLSPDFNLHPVGMLSSEIYGLHNREHFSIYAYSLALPQSKDDLIYQKIMHRCDFFNDVSSLAAKEIAHKIYDDEIDILIDLAGYTRNAMPEVLAMKPSPIQINYLGYPSTMGADFTLASTGEASWSEALITLPFANCPFDVSADNADAVIKRQDYGLPEGAFVFCSFGQSAKIEPTVFSVWMRILNDVPQSVLWLTASHQDVPKNIWAEAKQYGIAPERIIFAPLLPHAEHIKRYQIADLFLDTLWHNAHTNAIDALWQGLPLVTCMGELPSSRLAASLLNAIEMPELITSHLYGYEKTIVHYATHHQEHIAMREKLKAKRYTAPLFNMQLTVKHIESAYQQIWQRYCNGLPPANIRVIETNQVKPVTWRDIALF